MTENNTGLKDLEKVKNLKNEISRLKKEIAFKEEIFELSPNYIILMGLNGEILEVNNAVKQLISRVNNKSSPEKISNLKIIPPDEYQKYIDCISIIFNNKNNRPFKSYFLDKGGESRHVKVYISPVKSENEIIAVSIFATDITDLKLMKDSLRESLSLHKATLESVANGILVVNQNGIVTSYNHKFLEMWDIPSKMISPGYDEQLLDYISGNLKNPLEFREKIKKLYDNPREISIDTLEFKDGRVYQRYSQPQIIGNKVTGRVWSFSDQTKFKKTKESLRESIAYYKTIFEHSGTATLMVEENNTISLANSETENIFGYHPLEIINKKTWMDFVLPEYIPQMMEYQRLRYTNSTSAPENYEFRIIDKYGRIKDIYANVCLIPGTRRTLASIIDVTERNRAIARIKESENRYRTLAEAVEEFVFILNKEDQLEYIHEYAARKWELNPEEVLGKPRCEIFPPETNEIQGKYLQRVFEIKKTVRGENLLTMSPESMWLDTLLIPLKNEDGNVEKVLVVARDITEQKEYELLLSRQNEIHKAMGTILTEAIVAENEDELTKTCLSVCEAITHSEFGFICERNVDGDVNHLAITPTLLGDCNLEDYDFYPILKKLQIKDLWKHLQKTKKPLIFNELNSLELEILMGNEPIIKNMLISPLLRNGEFVGMLGLCNKESGFDFYDRKSMENISTTIVEALLRKRAEEKLKQALNDKEMLVREIHHRTKNNLMIMASLLNLTSADIEDEKSREIFHQIQTRAKSMALIHEKLYRSNNIKQINFGDYIRHLAQDLFNSFLEDPERVELVMELEDLNLDINTAIPLGLILNELLTNSMKYAFPEGQCGTITIKFFRKAEKYVMIVNDDGIGLSPDFDINQTDTLGLQLVKSLIGQIEGYINVQCKEGTCILIRFQEDEYLS
ncbi:PAS domain S-box protein [Methanobacterium subterraneum]|uniref:PAS domain S-box protein n=2 Tax=Methanobacterium subterraneum TaxID=59277 RepID=A0A7K4DIR2_9EURY|nr:PAS domain S-box protein [Methanobacterium subterraneum]NMO08257.1 PAS domain S-box protein [Methanobacterium subterraneum]